MPSGPGACLVSCLMVRRPLLMTPTRCARRAMDVSCVTSTGVSPRPFYCRPMPHWYQMSIEAPDLAEAGRALWQEHGLMYLATVRADGSPRLHPVVPVLADGGIYIAIADQSPKWHDLRREARCVLHALPGPRDDEFVLRCRAREAPGSLQRLRAAAKHVIHNDDHIFEFDIELADLGWWEHVGQPGTYSVRTRWSPGAGLRRLPGLRTSAGENQ